MKMKKWAYYFALFACGIIWFIVAELLGREQSVYGKPYEHFVCALITAFFVGLVFKNLIIKLKGWNWYLLPLLTVLVASALYGFLVPVSFILTGVPFQKDLLISYPFLTVYGSMTFYLPLLYPLALITQFLLRRLLNWLG